MGQAGDCVERVEAVVTPEQLAEIRARAEAATPGPWMQGFPHRGQVAFGPDPNSMYAWTSERGQLVVGNAKVGADVRFVAHARTDIPALLDYIEELQEAVRAHLYRISSDIDLALAALATPVRGSDA